MKIETVIDIYGLISSGIADVPLRKRTFSIRKKALHVAISTPLVKQAFDTRRIDQERDFNPRRGLQNYNRSEEFISEALEQKIKNFAKLRKILVSLKDIYGREHEWQDSNARVLLSTLDNGLRAGIQDGDFTESQPAMGSFDYIEELLHVRYRLGLDSINKMGEADLKKIILAKDEELTRKGVEDIHEINKHDVSTKSYDTLLDKLFGGVKATKENPEVERTITITIKDKFVEK